MTGFDCNLRILQDKSLIVQFGGCFAQDPEIKSSWYSNVDTIFINNQSLQDTLGLYLLVEHFKNNVILIPSKNKKLIDKFGYNVQYCFWKNLMNEKGLQLPEESEEFYKLK